ncbi:MAG: tetratricopeptide repeat protein [Desulfovibrionaceae bacterium]
MPRPTLLLAACLLACALGASACAARAPRTADAGATPGAPLSENARRTYAYLLYLDQRTELIRATQDDPQPGTPGFDRAIEIQKRADAAIALLVEAEPSPSLYGEWAALYFNPRQAGHALVILDQGLERYPDHRELTGLTVNAYLLKGDRDMAGVVLEAYSLRHPDDVEATIRLAGLLVEAGEHARALDQIARIPEDERNDDVLYLKARSESRLGNRAEARKTIRSILQNDPDHYDALTELAFIQELAAEFDQAAATYQHLLELGGPEAEIRQRLITLNLKLNRVDEALNIALEGPQTKAFLLKAASLFLNQDFPAQASAVLDRLGAAPPVPAEYFFYKAVIAFEAEDDPEKALDFLDQIPVGDENYGQALLFRTQINMHLGRNEEALALADKGRERFPMDSRFDRAAAEILSLDGDYADALAVLEEALTRHADDPELLYQYGALLEMDGRRDEALRTMERILERHPDNADALNYVGYTLADQGRDLARARVLIESALKQKPDNGAITDSLAWVQHKQGEHEAAWKTIKKAATLIDSDPVVWEHYGDIASALGHKAEAAEGYRRALKLAPDNAEDIRKKLESL